MSENQSAILTGNIQKTLLRFSIPIILSMLASQMYALVDNIIIGRFLNGNALAAVSNASSVLMIFLFISGGMELGCGLLVAAKLPALDQKGINRLLYNILFLDALIGILATVIGLFAFPWLLTMIHSPKEIMASALTYGRIYLLCLTFQMVYDVSRELLIGMGNSKLPMVLMISTSCLNIILDLLLVPWLGVAGAAVATAFSQVVGFFLILTVLRKQFLTERFHFRFLSPEYARDIGRLAPPNAVQQASGVAAILIKQSLLGGIGVAAIAGVSCVSKISNLLLIPIFGMTQALVIFTAQNLTAGQDNRVKQAHKISTRMVLIYTAMVVAVCMIFHNRLPCIFTDETEVIKYGALILTFEPLSYFLFSIRLQNEAWLRGYQKMSLYLISNIGTIALNIFACVICVNSLGFTGFYVAPYISNTLGVILSYGLVHKFIPLVKNKN
ncbi:MAG: MATE family efflux transporter [Lachnospiraceae bacterium]